MAYKLMFVLTVATLACVTQARFPKSLQDRWGYLDTNEYKARNTRVIGGQDAGLKEAPFQTSLLRDYLIIKSHMCGGSLITPRTIVTAAHCTDGQKASNLINRMGTNKRSQPGASYPDLKTQKIIQHENYDSNTIQNDISLLILPSAVTPSDAASFVEIETEDLPDGASLTLYGWGLTNGNSQTLPENLQVGKLSVVGQSKCQDIWGDVNAITSGMICALADATSACNGDSGGPLISANKKLTGIVSWGPSGCPVGQYPSVFTKPSAYLDWINANKVA